MKNKDLIRLYHLQEAINFVFEFTKGITAKEFFEDEM